MHLVDAANLMTPAYLAILSKGYAVQVVGEHLIAERGDNRFVADGPIALLGIISMVETRGETWQASDNEIDEFVSLFG